MMSQRSVRLAGLNGLAYHDSPLNCDESDKGWI